MIVLDMADEEWRGVVATVGGGGIAIQKESRVKAAGFDRGMIVNMKAAARQLSQLLEGLGVDARTLSKGEVVVLISGEIQTSMVEGAADVNRGEITYRDIEESHRAAYRSSAPRGGHTSMLEKIQFYPVYYILNGNENHRVIFPLGMQATHLLVRGYLLSGPRTFVSNLRKLLHEVGVPRPEFHLRSFGLSHWLTTDEERYAGILVLQTGESMVDGVVWERNYPRWFFTLDVGWKDFVEHISRTFQVPLDVARDVLNGASLFNQGNIATPSWIEVEKGGEHYTISRQDLISVLNHATSEFLNLIHDQGFKNPEHALDFLDVVHAVVFSGPFILLDGLDILVSETWRRQVRNLEPPSDVVAEVRELPPGKKEDFLQDDPEMFPLLGMVRWKYLERTKSWSTHHLSTNGTGWVEELRSWVRQWMKKLNF